MVLSDDLRVYIRHAWHVVEPSTIYLENWHIDLIAEYLEAVTAGQIKRLLINMPPRYAKSTCVSIMWPTWVWTREGFPGMPHNPTLEGPGTKWMFASYADELRTKHSLDRRKMLQSDWYRARWPKPAELTGDQNVKTLFTNSSSGQMFATTMTGAGTGLGGNYIVIDDPHKTKEESTSADVKAQVAVYGDTFATRHDDKKQGVTVIVMQRINDLDLSAHVLATAEEEYVHLKIEAEATEHRSSVSRARFEGSRASRATFYGRRVKGRSRSAGRKRSWGSGNTQPNTSRTRSRRAARSFSASGSAIASTAIPIPAFHSGRSCAW
jgi:hypothetical protein